MSEFQLTARGILKGNAQEKVMIQSTLDLNEAINLMHKGRRLMLMHTKSGLEYFIVPGGRVARKDAETILQRPDVAKFDDGLFPGNPQSWKMGQR